MDVDSLWAIYYILKLSNGCEGHLGQNFAVLNNVLRIPRDSAGHSMLILPPIPEFSAGRSSRSDTGLLGS